MISPKLFVAIFASFTLSFSVMADNGKAFQSKEEQCKAEGAYMDAEGYWQECDEFEAPDSDENQEWPESAGEPEEYEEEEEYEDEDVEASPE